MAKKKRSVNAPKRIKKPEVATKPVNPFEIHYNKIKRDAIGRRLQKGEIGKPTKSRDEAFKKRSKTLLLEYKHKDKSGKGLQDRRAKDESTRKAKVFEIKMKQNKEDEGLTHRGKTITTALDDRPEFDRDEDETNLLARADYIEAAHFGGGDETGGRTQAEFMLEMIQEKHKRQKEKEENLCMTERLDDQFDELRALVQAEGNKKEEEETKQDVEHDSEYKAYDVLLGELKFKPDGKATGLKRTSETKRDGESGSNASSSKLDQKVNERKARREHNKSLIDASRHIPAPRSSDFVILPMIEPKVDRSLRDKLDPTKKLQKKVKREFRGAQRELRKDNRFMKEVMFKETREADAERKRKVNRIIGDLANDLHEYKKSQK